MESVQKNIDVSILLAPVVLAVYLLVALESYIVETSAFTYVFQM